MTETPADTSNGPEAAAQSRSAYLPVLPSGWEYRVALLGPGGASVQIEPRHDLAQEVMRVSVTSAGGDHKDFTVLSLKDAAKSASNAAKALSQIAEHEAAARTAKQKLLDTIGTDAADDKPASKAPKPQQDKASTAEVASSPER